MSEDGRFTLKITGLVVACAVGIGSCAAGVGQPTDAGWSGNQPSDCEGWHAKSSEVRADIARESGSDQTWVDERDDFCTSAPDGQPTDDGFPEALR